MRLIKSVTADRRNDEQEQAMFHSFFAEFIAVLDDRTVVNPAVSLGGAITGLCAVRPDIRFDGAKFCFTGASSRYERTELSQTVTQLGGEMV